MKPENNESHYAHSNTPFTIFCHISTLVLSEHWRLRCSV